MTCCFMNFHEQESEKDLIKHFDREIEHAIDWGCSFFMTGTKYPEDKLFAERVTNMAKYYNHGEIKLVCLNDDDETLKKLFIQIADWEIYSYDVGEYPMPTK